MAQVLTSLGIACFIGAGASVIAIQFTTRRWRKARVARGEALLVRPFDMLQAVTDGADGLAVRRSAIAFNALVVIGVLLFALRDSI